jgi:hypothetical protein
MPGFNVGEGVKNALAAANDMARSNEEFINGGTISQTFGRDAIYYYIAEDNAVRRLPFEDAAQ